MTLFDTQMIRTARMNFHYRSHGELDKPVMLLIHGSFASGRWWEPLMSLLPDEIWAIAPDMRGCGQSEKREHGYTIEAQAEDLAGFIDAMQLHNIDLVAHSSGAAIAVEYALSHPDRLATLTLVNPAPVEGVFTLADGIRALEQMRTDRELLSDGLAAMMPSLTRDTPDNARFFAHLVEDAANQDPAAFTATARALSQWNRFADAKYLTLPTVIIWGDRDEIVDRDAMTRTLIAIPGANNLEVLRGVGHSPMIEAPLRLAERIINFVTEDFSAFEEIHARADTHDDDAL